jgi:hypothetical protein
VKKHFLLISLLAYFLPAVAGAEKARFRTPFTTSLVQPRAFIVLAADHPHSEFEVISHIVFPNSNFRQQCSPGFIDASEAEDNFFYKNQLPGKHNSSPISSKQYLFQIYPSHNFW